MDRYTGSLADLRENGSLPASWRPKRRRWLGPVAQLGIGVALGWALALTALWFLVGRG